MSLCVLHKNGLCSSKGGIYAGGDDEKMIQHLKSTLPLLTFHVFVTHVFFVILFKLAISLDFTVSICLPFRGY
jgi:hypothetical protein